MARNVIINGVTYNDVPQVNIPTTDNQTAVFYDTSDGITFLQAGNLLTGSKAYGAFGAVIGTMANNGALSATISDKTTIVPLQEGYYTSGAIGISAQEQEKIISGNIKSGVTILGVSGSSTVKDVSDTTATTATVVSGYEFYGASGAKVQGSLTVPVISQDSVTKVLSIS